MPSNSSTKNLYENSSWRCFVIWMSDEEHLTVWVKDLPAINYKHTHSRVLTSGCCYSSFVIIIIIIAIIGIRGKAGKCIIKFYYFLYFKRKWMCRTPIHTQTHGKEVARIRQLADFLSEFQCNINTKEHREREKYFKNSNGELFMKIAIW